MRAIHETPTATVTDVLMFQAVFVNVIPIKILPMFWTVMYLFGVGSMSAAWRYDKCLSDEILEMTKDCRRLTIRLGKLDMV